MVALKKTACACLSAAAKRLVCTMLAVFAALISASAPLRAAEPLELIEQKIQAGLLYNFLKYTEWPARADAKEGSPIVVCLFGGDPFAGNLQPMAGRSVNQHVIDIKRPQTLAETDGCSLLFINATQSANWPQMHAALEKMPILTVSNFPGFAMAGGMIEFTRTENRVGVAINTAAVTEANLLVGDRLLKLATPVRAGSSPAAEGP
jgi:hypothetical protein